MAVCRESIYFVYILHHDGHLHDPVFVMLLFGQVLADQPHQWVAGAPQESLRPCWHQSDGRIVREPGLCQLQVAAKGGLQTFKVSSRPESHIFEIIFLQSRYTRKVSCSIYPYHFERHTF